MKYFKARLFFKDKGIRKKYILVAFTEDEMIQKVEDTLSKYSCVSKIAHCEYVHKVE